MTFKKSITFVLIFDQRRRWIALRHFLAFDARLSMAKMDDCSVIIVVVVVVIIVVVIANVIVTLEPWIISCLAKR